MADPVNGLLAARMDPERRRRIGNALLAYQYDRETPQDAAVTERAGLFPLATYANGQTGPAWPGLIATPVEKMAQVLRGEITPGTPEFNEAGFDIAGAAMVGGLAAARPRGSLGMSGRPTERQGIRAYHGSPHDFDKFDMSKIGTGEGAQAYGHGLYFAENEGVAKAYKDRLTQSNPSEYMHYEVDGKIVRDHWARKTDESLAAKLLFDRNNDKQAVLRMVDHLISIRDGTGGTDWKKVRTYIENFNGPVKLHAQAPGRVYEVRINADPSDFLDWDKPLSQQSEKVRAGLNKLWGGGLDETAPAMRYAPQMPEMVEKAKNLGIPGIKYLDQGSRSAGEGSRNYVVFDANLIEILKKYGLLGMLGAGGMAQELMKPSKPSIPDDAA